MPLLRRVVIWFLSQDYGPKVNFKRQKINTKNFTGLPQFSKFVLDRIKNVPELQDFQCVELCDLEYSSDRESCIDPHLDDFWLWGERLITLNLMSGSALTLTPVQWDSSSVISAVHVDMLRRSLFVLMKDARYKWNHAIDPVNVNGTRIAMTFRELSTEFLTGDQRHVGEALLQTANTFKGGVIQEPVAVPISKQ